jgi:hypothetical protein
MLTYWQWKRIWQDGNKSQENWWMMMRSRRIRNCTYRITWWATYRCQWRDIIRVTSDFNLENQKAENDSSKNTKKESFTFTYIQLTSLSDLITGNVTDKGSSSSFTSVCRSSLSETGRLVSAYEIGRRSTVSVLCCKTTSISTPAVASHLNAWICTSSNYKQTKQTPWPLVCKQTIPTERPPLVDEI